MTPGKDAELAPRRNDRAKGQGARFAIRVDDGKLRVAGELRMVDAASIWQALRKCTASRIEPLVIDLHEASVVDGGIMSLLVELRLELAERGVDTQLVGASEHLRPLLHLYGGDEAPELPSASPRLSFVEHVAEGYTSVLEAAAVPVRFIGEVVEAVWGSIRHPATANWSSIPGLLERAGADGMPIVLLLDFLVGVVMAYQSARQLQVYGANIYVADVVGISVTRELVPLMTAFIMSGRSGAAYAAELGTMKVSDELDALRTLGFAPLRYLVIPRIVALVLVAPVLTLCGDVMAALGGTLPASTELAVSPGAYFAELKTAVSPLDVVTGLIKSVAFAFAIAFTGCQQGFATSGGAAGVGRRTTSTVVGCLLAVVFIDTVLTFFFRSWQR